MSTADYVAAKRYILERLRRELAPDLYYHGCHHTQEDVLPAVERLAQMEAVSPADQLLLRTAALYHDSGYLERYAHNEPVGVQLAAEALPDFGYSAPQIEAIGQIIMVTQLPQVPGTHLEAIMCDADLDSLGREDFFVISHRLRLELAAYGQPTSVREWYQRQLVFLQNHRYFTKAARTLRKRGKEQNIREIRHLLVEA